MPKVRKVARRKKFRHTINRKKLNKKSKKLPNIPCAAIKECWDDEKTVNANMRSMGLSSNPNVTLAIPNSKDAVAEQRLYTRAKKLLEEKDPTLANLAVAERLEQEAKERKRKCLRLSQMQVDKLAYFIEKYDKDYQAMTRDRMNYDQHTWKQLRAQIKKFMECKEQWDEYWQSREVAPPERTIVKQHNEDSD